MTSLHFRNYAEYYQWVAETWPHLIAGMPTLERKWITDLETASASLPARDAGERPYRKQAPLRRRRGR
jgi:hypothetical protein